MLGLAAAARRAGAHQEHREHEDVRDAGRLASQEPVPLQRRAHGLQGLPERLDLLALVCTELHRAAVRQAGFGRPCTSDPAHQHTAWAMECLPRLAQAACGTSRGWCAAHASQKTACLTPAPHASARSPGPCRRVHGPGRSGSVLAGCQAHRHSQQAAHAGEAGRQPVSSLNRPSPGGAEQVDAGRASSSVLPILASRLLRQYSWSSAGAHIAQAPPGGPHAGRAAATTRSCVSGGGSLDVCPSRCMSAPGLAGRPAGKAAARARMAATTQARACVQVTPHVQHHQREDGPPKCGADPAMRAAAQGGAGCPMDASGLRVTSPA